MNHCKPVKQKHYESEKQILDKIDARRNQAREINAEAESLEGQSARFFKASYDAEQIAKSDQEWIEARSLKGRGFQCKEEAMKARKRAKRIEEVVLPALGETLSEFRTAPMILVVGNDHSVASLV